MAKRERILKLLDIENSPKVVEVSLYYNLGGWNYFSGVKEIRGLYLSATPVEIGEGFRGFTAFSGTAVLVKELSRFNQRELDNFEANEEDITRLVNDVLNKNQLTLKNGN